MVKVKQEKVRVKKIQSEHHLACKSGAAMAIHYEGGGGMVQQITNPGHMTPIEAADYARMLLAASYYASGEDPPEGLLDSAEEVEQP